LIELSFQDRLIVEADAATPVRFVGAGGVGVGVGVGVAVGVGVTVGVGVGVGVEVGVGVGVGVGVALLSWKILATDGTPFPFRIKSM
jgi:hypothetical protein